MASTEITRNLEKGGLYVPKFWTGLYTNRSPLYTPISALGIQLVQRQDTLWNGLNMQITPQFTLRRRYGFVKTQSTYAFGSSEWPLGFSSFEDITGTVRPIADTTLGVDLFTSAGRSQITPKAFGTGQSSFNAVGDTLYWCDGVSAYKFIGPNLLTESNTFSNAIWYSTGCTLTSGQADPLGGSTATQVVYSLTTSVLEYGYPSSPLIPNYTLVANNTYTFSAWIKSATGAVTIELGINNQSNVSRGMVTVTPTTSWARYSVTVTMNNSDTGIMPFIGEPGSGTSTFDIYGAQLEANSAPTPYQGTTTMPQGAYLMGIVPPAFAPGFSLTSGSLSPTVGYQYVYCFYNSETGTLSTASAPCLSTGPLTSKNIMVAENGSADPQVSQIQIFRTADGGAVYYYLASITNPGNTGWSYTDSTPDSGLNNLLIAPIAFANNPPPTGMNLLVWYAGRLWGASGNTLYFSGGPDTTNGVGEECWPPGNNYAVPGNINALVATSTGLIIFTKDNAYVVTGTTSATFTVPQLWQANWGVQSQNCVTQDGDNVFIFTSRGQVYNFSASGVAEIGWPIAAQLGAFTPANSYITIHRSGGQGSDADEGVFVGDGSANIYRYSQVTQSWDPVMQPVGGVGAIASIEMPNAAWNLVMGRPTGAGYILQRSQTTWTDDGQTYTANVVFGSLTVSPPRTVAVVSSIPMQVVAVGTYPTVSVMLNEVTDTGTLPATFTALPNPVPDPPQLPQSVSLWTKRHDLKSAQVPLPQYVQHLQIKVAFVAEAQPNEIWGFGVS